MILLPASLGLGSTVKLLKTILSLRSFALWMRDIILSNVLFVYMYRRLLDNGRPYALIETFPYTELKDPKTFIEVLCTGLELYPNSKLGA